MPFNVVKYGPVRTIGMSLTGKPDEIDFTKLWEDFMKRAQSLQRPGMTAYGFCRCVPGVTDGGFEYVAALAVAADMTVPEGMIEVRVPPCEYAVFEVSGISDIGAVWESVQKEMGTQTDHEAYCGPKGCQCATHPSFEMYPASFEADGRLAIYMPVKAVAK